MLEPDQYVVRSGAVKWPGMRVADRAATPAPSGEVSCRPRYLTARMESLDNWFFHGAGRAWRRVQTLWLPGSGIVSPIGIGSEPFWAALCEGRSGIRRLPRFDGPDLPPPFGGEVADFDPKQYVRPRKSLKVMSRDIQLGFAAADLACADAGLREAPVDPERLGVMLGADLISCELDELVGTYRQCIGRRPVRFRPLGPGGHGRVVSAVDAEVSAQHAGLPRRHCPRRPRAEQHDYHGRRLDALGVGRGGARAGARAGRRDHRRRGRLAAPSRCIGCAANCSDSRGASGDPAAASRPFDATRDGLVDGEGAAAFILETRRHAQARGAQDPGPHPRLCQRVSSRAATGSLARARPCAAPSRGALAAAGLKPAELGFVVAHGMSTIEGDRIEAQAIREVLGDVPVTAPKSYFGYLGGGVGRVGDGRRRVGVRARAGAAHAELRASRSAMSDQRDPRPAAADRPPDGLILSYSSAGPGGGVGAGGSAE